MIVDPKRTCPDTAKRKICKFIASRRATACEYREMAECGASIGTRMLTTLRRGIMQKTPDILVVHREPDKEAVELAQQIQKCVIEHTMRAIEKVVVLAFGKYTGYFLIVVISGVSIKLQETVHMIDGNDSQK